MVENHIRKRGIIDVKILAAFQKVPRHRFISARYQDRAYSDSALRIDCNQTISQPYIVALMLNSLKIEPQDTVLEIGTGSGYQTALLAELAGNVYTMERIEDLMIQAKIVLQELAYNNIHFRISDGTLGWQGDRKFDKIVVSAACPEAPKSLLNQLSEGGKMVLPTGNKYIQELVLLQKNGNSFSETRLGGCRFVPLIGAEGWSDE